MTRTALSIRDAAHLIHPVTEPSEINTTGPRIVMRADGVYIYDEEDREIIDGFAGLWCVAVGHGRKEIRDAVTKQMEVLEYATTFHGASHPVAIELAERLAGMFPKEWGMSHVMFSSGGSEANETNFKLVRLYWSLVGEDRRKTIVARNHGYHGLTIATMTATGIMPLHWNFGPEAPGFAHIPAPYCYRCELQKTFPECGIACADSLSEYIEQVGPETVGAFIAEPVIGAGGIIPPPPGYFKKIREICDKYGILFIADEVVCGFGRTGEMFGMGREDVRSDIVTLAKGLTSGYLPLGASVISEKIWKAISEGLPNRMPLSHGFTYSGHPVCSAAALANLDIIENENLVDNAREVGAYLMEKMKGLEKYDSVGDVRGVGLMIGIEFVADKATKRGFSNPHTACAMVEHEAWERGLYCRAMGIEVIGLAPPLSIDKTIADQMVAILAESIEAMEAVILKKELSRPKREQVNSAASFFNTVLPDKLSTTDSGDIETTVCFALGGKEGGKWLLTVTGGSARVAPVGENPGKTDATIIATALDFVKIVNGEMSGADAFMNQKIVVEGDLGAAANLMSLGIL